MFLIVSKKRAKRKKNSKLKNYWRLLETPSYVDLMTKENKCIGFSKLAKQKLQDVPLKGTIRQNKNGFVYVEVSNDVIHGLFTLIDEKNIEKPPYFGGKNKIGAHVSLISDEEIKDHKIEMIEEIGDEIHFSLGEMFSVKPDWKEMERVWFVEVESQEFIDLRQKYGLPKSYKGKRHPYHITFAVRRKK